MAISNKGVALTPGCGRTDMELTMYSRRSGRIAKRIPLTLRWQAPGCDFEDHAAETKLLSRHGCMLVCDTRVRPGSQLYVLYPERGKSTKARVVYHELTGKSDQISVALEFLSPENFWQIDFPPANRLGMN